MSIPSNTLRDSAPHLSGAARPFTSPPLLPGLVDQIRILLGSKAKPTPIQALSLDHFFLNDSNVVGREETLLAAETGSGKSLAYLLPIVQSLKQTESNVTWDEPSLPSPRALILTPTHELSRQIKSMLSQLTHAPDTKLRSVCVSSGSSASLSARPTASQLLDATTDGSGEFRVDAPPVQGSRGVDVVIGTPAKILDLTRPGGRHSVGPKRPGDDEFVRREVQREVKLSLAAIEWIVVDEADVLFDPDFSLWTTTILQDIQSTRLTLSFPKANLILTTATISAHLSSYLSTHHPTLTRLTTPNLHRLPASLQTEHVHWDRRPGNRYPTVLRKLQDTWAEEARLHPGWEERSKVVIFCNRSKKVEELGTFLEEKGVR
ncbi:RNA helicase, partial [Ceratobasidium sp. 392]